MHRYGQATGEFLQVGGKSPSKVRGGFLLVGLALPSPGPSGQAYLGFTHPTPMYSLSVAVDSQTTEDRLRSKPQGPENERYLPSLIWTSDDLLCRSWHSGSKQVSCLEVYFLLKP